MTARVAQQVQPVWVRNDVTRTYWQEEWQRVPHSQQALFEHLCLLVFQNGLGWATVLKRREALRELFDGFDPVALAQRADGRAEVIVQETAGIRNLAKIRACLNNARVLTEQEVSLVALYRRAFPKPLIVASANNVPRTHPATDAVSARLLEAGCQRTGPVVACSLAQAAGFIRVQEPEL